MSVPEFRRVVRGYDTDDVARYVSELSDRLERLENERAENARTIQRLNHDVTDAKEKAGRAKPSFAELGSAFEETLRLAEEQSGKIAQEAAAEAAEALGNARSEATRVRESAAKDSRKILSDAQRTSEDLRLETDLRDASHVSFVATEGRANEGVDEQQGFINAVLSRPYCADVGVVVFAREHSGIYTPHQSSPHTFDLVGGHLFTVARTAENNS